MKIYPLSNGLFVEGQGIFQLPVSIIDDENQVTLRSVKGNITLLYTDVEDFSGNPVGTKPDVLEYLAAICFNSPSHWDNVTTLPAIGLSGRGVYLTVDDGPNLAGLYYEKAGVWTKIIDTDVFTNVDAIFFNTSPPSTPHTEGKLTWNPTDKTLDLELEDEVTLQIGQESHIRVLNTTGSQINNGQAVYISGATVGRPIASLAQANSESTSKYIGIATMDIPDGSEGFITQFGFVRNINTSSFTLGDKVWLSQDVAGGITNVKPGQYPIFLGFAVKIHSSTGAILVTADSMADIQRANYVLVRSLTDFPAPVSSVITLVANTIYEVSGGVNVGTNRFVTNTSNLIIGMDKSDDKLIYTGTSAMFTNTNKDLSIVGLTLAVTTAGGSLFSFTGTTNKAEIRECVIATKSMGTINGADIFTFRDNLITGCDNGITFPNCANLIVVDNIWKDNLGTITNLTIPSGGTFSTILIGRNLMSIGTGQTGLNIDPTITISNGNLTSNIFSGTGTKIAGFSHLTTNWIFVGNRGIANKRVILTRFSDADIKGLALTSPSTSAAGASFLSGTGARFLTFRGGNNQDDGASCGFQVPSDYFSGGFFILNATTDTGILLNVKMFMGLSKVPVGDNYATLDETGLNVIIPIQTAFNRVSSTITPITTTFAADDNITVKVWRDPDDAADTALALSYYLNNIQFVYDAS